MDHLMQLASLSGQICGDESRFREEMKKSSNNSDESPKNVREGLSAIASLKGRSPWYSHIAKNPSLGEVLGMCV